MRGFTPERVRVTFVRGSEGEALLLDALNPQVLELHQRIAASLAREGFVLVSDVRTRMVVVLNPANARACGLAAWEMARAGALDHLRGLTPEIVPRSYA